MSRKQFETSADKIVKELRKKIMTGVFKPNEHLIQDELAKQFGVSRMPIREAFKQLELENLLILEPHKGAVVKSFSLEEIKEIYYLRSKFETFAFAESIKFFDQVTINKLRDLNTEMKKTEDVEDFIELNIDFHHTLISKAPSKRLKKFICDLWNGFPQQTPHLLSEQIATSKEEHEQIIQAIENENHELAVSILAVHINRSGQNVIDNLKKIGYNSSN